MKLLSLLLIFTASFANAEVVCMNRHDMLKILIEDYEEQPVFQGMIDATRMFETWYNPVTGTWSHTLFQSDGKTCLVASGKNGEMFSPEIPGDL